PDAVALSLRARDVSYAELERTARLWAAALVHLTGGRPERVGIFASRSEVSYGGVLASLCAGATFVPLNPKFPVGRTREMLQSAGVDALVVDANGLQQLDELVAGLERPPRVLAPTRDGDAALLSRTAPLGELPAVAAGHAAYLL